MQQGKLEEEEQKNRRKLLEEWRLKQKEILGPRPIKNFAVFYIDEPEKELQYEKNVTSNIELRVLFDQFLEKRLQEKGNYKWVDESPTIKSQPVICQLCHRTIKDIDNPRKHHLSCEIVNKAFREMCIYTWKTHSSEEFENEFFRTVPDQHAINMM